MKLVFFFLFFFFLNVILFLVTSAVHPVEPGGVLQQVVWEQPQAAASRILVLSAGRHLLCGWLHRRPYADEVVIVVTSKVTKTGTSLWAFCWWACDSGDIQGHQDGWLHHGPSSDEVMTVVTFKVMKIGDLTMGNQVLRSWQWWCSRSLR